MPQDIEAETKLRNLAAVPYQLISPANNTAIIGIYRTLLGVIYSLVNMGFNKRKAMDLLMMSSKIDASKLQEPDRVSNFDVISQILPPMTMKYNIKSLGENEDKKTSNSVLEITNGRYVRGQMVKSTLGSRSRGLIHRICNDFGNMSASHFVDDIQNIVTEYLCSTSFSVGISDLLSNEATTNKIVSVIADKKNSVKDLFDQTQIGVFENNSGKTNKEEFEQQVNNILNQAMEETGSISCENLDKGNRFVTMVNADLKVAH